MSKFILKNVRISFPALFEPKAFNGESNPSYEATFLIDPKDPQVAELNAAIEAVAKEKWKDKADAVMKTLRAQDRLCLHDGDLKSNLAGYAGMLYLGARSGAKPKVYDNIADPNTNKAREITSAADGKPYSGSYVNARIDLWAMDNSYGKRVCASLVSVQFWKDGEAFSGGPQGSADDFETLGVGADVDDLI